MRRAVTRQKAAKMIKKAKRLKSKPFKGYNPKIHSRAGGLSAKGRAYFKRKEGANLKPPVTESNPKGKQLARKKSFCARSRGWKGPEGKAARRRWKC